MLSPPPPAQVLARAAAELLRRSAEATDPHEQLRAALAVAKATGSLPAELRCRAHVAAGDALCKYTEDKGQSVTHLRSALGLCAGISLDVWLVAVTTSMRVSQDFLRRGALTEARDLLETVLGVVQQREGTASVITQRLLAHASTLHVSLLLHEGRFGAARRLLLSVKDLVAELPAHSDGRRREKKACPDVTCASRDDLSRVLCLQHGLILMRMGEVDEAAAAFDELRALLSSASSDAQLPPRLAAVAAEADLAQAVLHIARLDFAAAFARLQSAQAALRPRQPSSAVTDALPTRRPSGAAACLLVRAQAALASGEAETAAGLLRRAASEERTAGRPSAPLAIWCDLLLGDLGATATGHGTTATERVEAMKRVSKMDEAKPLRALRSASHYLIGKARASPRTVCLEPAHVPSHQH